eukprot:m.51092 g.51092  ORF g.51092 m.51092 type:complete len:389 (+) comp11220_c0_seq1:91-1257(+)
MAKAGAARTSALYNELTMGMIGALSEMDGVVDVQLQKCKPAAKVKLQEWEYKHKKRMPADLTAFYLSTNGLNLVWSVLFGQDVLPLGQLRVFELGRVTKFAPTVLDLVDDMEHTLRLIDQSTAQTTHEQATVQPHATPLAKQFASESDGNWGGEFLSSTACGANVDAFAIDRTQNGDRIVFVVPTALDPKKQVKEAPIYMIDFGHRWHKLASGFHEYFRLMTLHQGLPGWHNAALGLPLSATQLQWFQLYAPLRLAIDRHTTTSSAHCHNSDGKPKDATAILTSASASVTTGGGGTKVQLKRSGRHAHHRAKVDVKTVLKHIAQVHTGSASTGATQSEQQSSSQKDGSRSHSTSASPHSQRRSRSGVASASTPSSRRASSKRTSSAKA